MITKVVDKRNAKQVRLVSLRLRTLVMLVFFITFCLANGFWILHKETLQQELLKQELLSREEKPKVIEKIVLKNEPQKEKLSLFLSEITRVRSYEKTIKERFEAIRNVVRSVVGADFAEDVARKKHASKASEKGVGGKEYSTKFDADLVSSIDFGIDFLNSAPIGMPLEGNVTSVYGHRTSPFTHKPSFHTGIDIAISKYSPVLSTADGIVTFAGYRQGYGNTVEISHKLGFKTLFAHLSAALVQPGQKVCREQIIGLVGMTGRTTGPHLHYEIKRNGVFKNPKPYLVLNKLLSVAVD